MSVQQEQTTTSMPVYKTNIIAVPVASENAFRPIQKCIDNKFLFDNYYKNANTPRHGTKAITTFDDYDRFLDMLNDIGKLNTEYYASMDYAPKQYNQNVQEYITNYIKAKGLSSYYTFREWYEVFINLSYFDELYYIVPLYIRLKNNKSFDQMKVIEYVSKEVNPDGFIVKPVNKAHFIRDPDEEEQYKAAEQEEVYEDLRIEKELVELEAQNRRDQ